MSNLLKKRAACLVQENRQYGSTLQRIDLPINAPADVVELWRSARFLVQVYRPEKGAQRISVNRTAIDTVTGRWLDGISWEDLQRIKREIGRGELDAVEIYPPDTDMVNVANMRHLWILEYSLPYAWRKAA